LIPDRVGGVTRLASSGDVPPIHPVILWHRLDAVLEDLRVHEAVLRSVDPNRQAVDAARIRAEASTAVLDAQRVAAKATEDAARSGERLAAERREWERERAAQRAELEELRTAVARASEQAASTQDAFDGELAAQRAELEGRDDHAARAAAAHEEETSSLLQELNGPRPGLRS
jgi:chromosome segregation ATPase